MDHREREKTAPLTMDTPDPHVIVRFLLGDDGMKHLPPRAYDRMNALAYALLGQDPPVTEMLDGAELVRFDERRVMFAWFGGHWVIVCDPTGHEYRHVEIGASPDRKVTFAEAVEAIERLIDSEEAPF
jgi:hypothetical protein